MTMTIKVILVVRAENDLSTELNVSWAGSSSSSCCSSATSVSLTLYEPAGNISYQLTGRKSNPIFRPIKYLIERTACLIQQVYYIE